MNSHLNQFKVEKNVRFYLSLLDKIKSLAHVQDT